MYKRKLFGTDGVRGIANIDPMTAEMALHIGRATAFICKEKEHRHRIVIGKDTRLSGYMLESALVSGICSMGVDVLQIGPMPTPGIAFLTRSMRADAGMVISASHNPFQDNGIKIFSRDGFKLPDQLEETIEKMIFNDTIKGLRPTADAVGKAFRIDDANGRYIVFLKNTFPDELDLEGLRLVIDCGNGAAYKIAPAVFAELGASITTIGVSPDGKNINDGCGSLHPERLQQEVIKQQAHLGIAFDGDADRVVFVDERGTEVHGDQVMAICALEMARKNQLKNNTLVATVMSNMGLEKALEPAGISVVRTQVGDRYVVEEMRQHGYNFGGEQSGHLIFMDHNTTGDGILSALQVLSVLVRSGKSLSELAQVMDIYPQVLKNVPVASKVPLDQVPALYARIKDVEQEIQGRGRLLVRYSGTENKLRVMMEGDNAAQINGYVDELAALVQQTLG
ncbi:MAG: phosphoglucosamine mutase [Deltaproteobacteria bacterium]|nr:phosphoglucosamine mutase [Candidatus Anaeroferrophillus wilburensis]MBN2888274.1 phosphoglucosamine mutase [Deltaproteobacteria bacterium]